MEIKKGDKVRLNSGGPVMTVGSFTLLGGRAKCTWFDQGVLFKGTFTPEQLVKYAPLQKQVLLHTMLSVRNGVSPEEATDKLYHQLYPQEPN